MFTIRAAGATSRIARAPAMAAAHRARRSRKRAPRFVPKGAIQPHSPPANAKKVISLTGVKKCGPRTRGTTYSAAARQ
jgi:hypothetical protein